MLSIIKGLVKLMNVFSDAYGTPQKLVFVLERIMYLNIAILKETQPNERRVSLDPTTAARLVEGGAKIGVQNCAWDYARLSGANLNGIFFSDNTQELLGDADIVLAVQPPPLEIINQMQEGAVLILYRHPEKFPELVKPLLDKRITSFVLTRVPYSSHSENIKSAPDAYDLIQALVKDRIIEFDWDSEILAESVFTHDSKIFQREENIKDEERMVV